MKWGYPAKKINMDAAVSAMRDYCRANNLDESAIDGYQRSWAVVVQSGTKILSQTDFATISRPYPMSFCVMTQTVSYTRLKIRT